MPVSVYGGQKARQVILEGVLELARAVAVTYGPRGRNVMMDRPAGHIVTKDGVSVAYEVQPENPLKRIGARTLLQACIRVRDKAGDGTTTTAILAAGLMRRAHKLIAAGHDPGELARGIQRAWAYARPMLVHFSYPVTRQAELEAVAMVSSNGDRAVSKALAEACMTVGKTGTVSIEDGRHVDIELEHRPGFEWDCGLDSTRQLGKDGSPRKFDIALVALVPAYLETVADVQSILEEGSQWPHPIIVVARRTAGAALATIVKNDQENEAIKCVSVRASRIPHDVWDNLEDLAALTGATIADPKAGRDHKKWDPEWFGSVQSGEIREKSASLISFENDETDDRILDRVNVLRARRDSTDFDFDRDRLDERIAKLSGGFCVMRVGGVTEVERRERRGRIEDCLGSVQGALREGVMPGAGTAYIRVHEVLEGHEEPIPAEDAQGWRLLSEALTDPLWWLARNAGKKPDTILERIYREMPSTGDLLWYGWDAKADKVRNLAAGPMVADPLTQVREVIDAAVSVATTLMTVEVALVGRAMKRRR